MCIASLQLSVNIPRAYAFRCYTAIISVNTSTSWKILLHICSYQIFSPSCRHHKGPQTALGPQSVNEAIVWSTAAHMGLVIGELKSIHNIKWFDIRSAAFSRPTFVWTFLVTYRRRTNCCIMKWLLSNVKRPYSFTTVSTVDTYGRQVGRMGIACDTFENMGSLPWVLYASARLVLL